MKATIAVLVLSFALLPAAPGGVDGQRSDRGRHQQEYVGKSTLHDWRIRAARDFDLLMFVDKATPSR